jgi:hypothetical protein
MGTDSTFIVERRTLNGACDRAERLAPALRPSELDPGTHGQVREAWYVLHLLVRPVTG